MRLLHKLLLRIKKKLSLQRMLQKLRYLILNGPYVLCVKTINIQGLDLQLISKKDYFNGSRVG